MLLQEQRKAANMSASFERQKLMQSFEKLQVRMHRLYMLDCAHDPIKSIDAAPARFHHNRDHNGHCELQLTCSFDHQPLIFCWTVSVKGCLCRPPRRSPTQWQAPAM